MEVLIFVLIAIIGMLLEKFPWLLVVIPLCIAAIAGLCFYIQHHKKKAAEKKRKEDERIASLRASEKQCVANLKRLLDHPYVDPENVKAAVEYIAKIPKHIPERNAIIQRSALRIAKQYADAIDATCTNAIINHKFNDAQIYLKFLSQVAKDKKYAETSAKIRDITAYYCAKTPYISSGSKGTVNTDLVNKLKGTYPDTQRNLSELIWRYALAEPFDIIGYQMIFSSLCSAETVDGIASLVYIESKYGIGTVMKIFPTYEIALRLISETSDTDVLRGIASIAAWCENSGTEIILRNE